jgi:prevent-host-death family protein
MKIGIQRARRHLTDIVAQVEAGQEIVITRRGKAVARLVPASRAPKRLPSLEGFRRRLAYIGTPTARLLRAERDE